MSEPVNHDPGWAPGGRDARKHGCCCSVLANAAFRAGAADQTPFVDPVCTVHSMTTPPSFEHQRRHETEREPDQDPAGSVRARGRGAAGG